MYPPNSRICSRCKSVVVSQGDRCPVCGEIMEDNEKSKNQ